MATQHTANKIISFVRIVFESVSNGSLDG
ncbi:TPA: hypothetical protein N0F65_012500 [Lagenidium giganteum]|uniref:Uncharacterized protein n=1 Tax=Lagenidium giganteum TaxID=4803 RepID=A0AAV2YV13_9STRA|nr:TPA: hypothetical protein N0F65_012500 [Lagenidium giganteum]